MQKALRQGFSISMSVDNRRDEVHLKYPTTGFCAKLGHEERVLRREAPHLTNPDQSQTTHDPDDLVQAVFSQRKEAVMTKMFLSSDQLGLWAVHRSLGCRGESSWTVCYLTITGPIALRLALKNVTHLDEFSNDSLITHVVFTAEVVPSKSSGHAMLVSAQAG
jgi:hypothetical protein